MLLISSVMAQQGVLTASRFNSGNLPNDTYNLFRGFIENKGQYGKSVKGYEQLGPVLYAYEGLVMPVLFTSKGLIHLQRKLDKLSHAEEERLEKSGMSEDEIEKKKIITDRMITMEWVNANPLVEVQAFDKASAYHTYRMIQDKAFSYGRLVYKDLYPGVDLVFHFSDNKKQGFEYSLKVKAGADLSRVQLRYGGDIISIKTNSKGQLEIKSSIEGVTVSVPVSYYGTDISNESKPEITTRFQLTDKTVHFNFPQQYDSTKAVIIDPFVSTTANLGGLNAGKAKDVDFDYSGNVYVTGGGAFTGNHSLAKFNAAGALQWTFNGSLSIPTWTYGTYYGGWMVEKPTGNVYLGQGFSPGTGFQVVRISTTGLYDNYITSANPSFMEAWKMYWSCNNGSPQILIAGGGINSNINFGAFAPPSATVTGLNITGIPYAGGTGWAQDIADFVFDPSTNDMYSIFGSTFGTPAINNRIYKNTAPYSAASVAWNVASGFTTIQEAANRPYLVASGLSDNSANMLSVNAGYLYYWDGKNLKAFNKTTGAGVGTPVTTGNTAFMQGGIIADACNNVFVGDANGLVKVYQFNGSNFNDAPADITIPGMAGKSVYDLAYDESRKLLYVSGDGFVASVDVSAYCPSTLYTINTTAMCASSGVIATVSPLPPAGSTVQYVLYIGNTQVASNSTGVFNGLSPNVTYTIVATINQFCNGSQTSVPFILPGPAVATTVTNTTCGNTSGAIVITGSGTTAPYTYSIDGINFQGSGTFTGLGAGVYTVSVKDVNGCTNTAVVTILNSNGPQLTLTGVNADCGNTNGSITANAVGGTTPYTYSIDGINFQGSNFFNGITSGTYTITVKDANNCINAVQITITSSPAPLLTAVPASATCGNPNGTITAFGSSGTPPLVYSINGSTYQSGNQFTGLTPGSYTVWVKDANGCLVTIAVVVPDSPAPSITALSTSATCNNTNGTITATGAGGIAPLVYSINGLSYQPGNIFTGLAAGNYIVYVKDVTGCINTVTVTVSNTNGPVLTATATSSACNVNSGSITAAASSGTAPYQYSINGISFQAGASFTTLAPGNYIVYVRDISGCIATFPVTVPATAGPLLSATATTTACGSNTGTITAAASGGTPPLQYSLDNTTYQAGNTFTGLSTGNYTVFVRDANGCTRYVNVVVNNTSGLTLSGSAVSSTCSGSTGTITAIASGGIAPLQYSINGTVYQLSNVFSTVAPGVYTLYVKDAGNCIVTRTVTVTASAGPTVTINTLFQVTCGGSNGVVKAIASGGVGPYQYSLDGGAFQSVPFFINLTTGLHTITVKDANNCTASATVTLVNVGGGTPPTDVTFVVKDALACLGQTGRIKNLKGQPSGGGATYIFSLDGGPFTTANQFTNVAPGVHTITAQNESFCNITKLVTIGSGTAATATATAIPANCGTPNGSITLTGVGANTPYHVSIDGGLNWSTFFPPGANSFTFAGLIPGTYQVRIADDADYVAGPPVQPGACVSTINVVVPSLGGPSVSTIQVNPSCGSPTGSITATGSGGLPPYTFSINGGAYTASSVFSNLTPGNYAISVQDASGCTNGTTVNLTGQGIPVVTATVIAAACNTANGSVTATGSGGVPPLEYSLNGTVFQSGNVFSGLAPGTYTLYVKDVNNCYSSIVVTVGNIQIPLVTAYTIAAGCNAADGSVIASGTGGTLPYTFSINGSVYQSSNTFSNLPAGFYTVYIKDDRGCISSTGVNVQNINGPGPLVIYHN